MFPPFRTLHQDPNPDPECPNSPECEDEDLYKILMIVFASVSGVSLIAIIVMAILCKCRDDADEDSFHSEALELETRKTRMPPGQESAMVWYYQIPRRGTPP